MLFSRVGALPLKAISQGVFLWGFATGRHLLQTRERGKRGELRECFPCVSLSPRGPTCLILPSNFLAQYYSGNLSSPQLPPFVHTLCCGFSSCHCPRDCFLGTNFYWTISVPWLGNSVPFLCSSNLRVVAASYCLWLKLSPYPLQFLGSFFICGTTLRYWILSFSTLESSFSLIT